jgi:hypothetical protein
MEIKMAENNPYAEYASTNLYDDGTGKGAVINQPIADPTLALKNQQSLRPGGAAQAAKTQEVQEEDFDYLASLFDGENLSEDFKLKAETIFQAAINEKVAAIEAQLVEAAKEVIEEQVSSKQNSIVEHVDGYLNYVINEWMQENKVAIERGLRTEIAENFINGLKSLFETSFIDVPEDKYNILDDLYEANSELQDNVNTLIKENINLKNEITARLCVEAFIEEAQGLADTQVEKLAKLAENIEFSNVDQYRQKVAILKESYFNGNSTESESKPQATNTNKYASGLNSITMLSENTGSFVAEEAQQPAMDSIVNVLSVLNKKSSGKANEITSGDRVRSLLNSGTVQDNFI